MAFRLKCRQCHKQYVRAGDVDHETNASEITDKLGPNCPQCGGDDVEIIEEIYPDGD